MTTIKLTDIDTGAQLDVPLALVCATICAAMRNRVAELESDATSPDDAELRAWRDRASKIRRLRKTPGKQTGELIAQQRVFIRRAFERKPT